MTPSRLIEEGIQRLLDSGIMHELTSEEIKERGIVTPELIQHLSDTIDQQIVDDIIKENNENTN